MWNLNPSTVPCRATNLNGGRVKFPHLQSGSIRSFIWFVKQTQKNIWQLPPAGFNVPDPGWRIQHNRAWHTGTVMMAQASSYRCRWHESTFKKYPTGSNSWRWTMGDKTHNPFGGFTNPKCCNHPIFDMAAALKDDNGFGRMYFFIFWLTKNIKKTCPLPLSENKWFEGSSGNNGSNMGSGKSIWPPKYW